jgi:hypothetical protein
MGIYVEGEDQAISDGAGTVSLPGFYPGANQQHYIEIFNKGKTPFTYSVQSGVPYIIIKPANGKVTEQERIWVSVDWVKAPSKTIDVPIIISGNGRKVTIKAIINNTPGTKDRVFHETNGYIAIEAQHYQKAVNSAQISWKLIPGYGRTLSGVTPWPVTATAVLPGANTPHLEYEINLSDTGTVSLETYVSPTIDFHNKGGLFYAISVDNEAPQKINISTAADSKSWAAAVSDNIRKLTTKHHITKRGNHTVKYWAVDPGVVLQKIVINAGGLKPSYLGPPE